mgnify:CR=1 FL=1
MKIKGKVNNKLYFFRPEIICKSEEHLYSFLKLNGFRKMLWLSKPLFLESPEVVYVSLEGQKTVIGDLSELTYSTIYKLCNNLTKIENNAE